MSQKLFLVDLNLNGNQIKNAVVEQLSAAPANPIKGQIYFDTTDSKFKYWNGTAWIAGAEYSAANKSNAEGTVAIYDGNTGNQFNFRVLKGDSSIKIANADGVINLTFDTTVVAGLIATAKQEAIDAAAADATNKANAAQTAAEATAKSYTDEQIGAEATRSDAKAKELADAAQAAAITEAGTAADNKIAENNKNYDTTTVSEGKIATAKQEAIEAAAADATSKADQAEADAIAAAKNADTRLVSGTNIDVVAGEADANGRITYTVNAGAALATDEEVNTKLEDYYTKSEVDGKVAGAFHFKGTVANAAALPTGASEGDVYQVEDVNGEYAWNGSEWVELGSILDLSAYKVLDADTTLNNGVKLTLTDGKVGVDASAAKTAWEGYADQAEADAKAYTDTREVEIDKKWAEADAVIDGKIAQEVTDRQGEITRVEGLVTTEATTRGQEITRVEGLVSTEASARETADNAIKNADIVVPAHYKGTATNGTAIAATTHKCGQYPLVQCFNGGNEVICDVTVDASGNVTIAYNGTYTVDVIIRGEKTVKLSSMMTA